MYGALLSPLPIDHKSMLLRKPLRLEMFAPGHTLPGHSPGSMFWWVKWTEEILFGQDIHGPLHEDLLSNQADYKNRLISC